MPHKPRHRNYYLNPTHSIGGDNQNLGGGVGKYATMTYLYEGKITIQWIGCKGWGGGEAPLLHPLLRLLLIHYEIQNSSATTGRFSLHSWVDWSNNYKQHIMLKETTGNL